MEPERWQRIERLYHSALLDDGSINMALAASVRPDPCQ
jgi:hypothetical protein